MKVAEKIQLSIALVIAALIGCYIAYRRYRKARRAQRLMFYMTAKYQQ